MDPDLKLQYERYILISITILGILITFLGIRDNIVAFGIGIVISVVMGMVWLCRFIFWWDDQ